MTSTTATSPKRRRMERGEKAQRDATPRHPAAEGEPCRKVSKLDQVEALLLRDHGASIAEIIAATGWQQHSVRGAMAGALKKKRGLLITSDKIDGVRRYCAERSQ